MWSWPALCLYRQFLIEELEQSREFFSSQNRLLKMLFAMYNLLSANSELVCYFIIVLNNVVSASVISLVLPILVFLWAMLSVPRPTKKFWMTAIIYTEVRTEKCCYFHHVVYFSSSINILLCCSVSCVARMSASVHTSVECRVSWLQLYLYPVNLICPNYSD